MPGFPYGSTFALPVLPVTAIVRCLDNYSAITRTWTNDDHRRCRRCDRCDAVSTGGGSAICTVIVDQPVAVEEAQFFSCTGFDRVGDGEMGSPPRLGLGFGFGPG